MGKTKKGKPAKRTCSSLRSKSLRAKVVQICKTNDVVYLAVFGSFARGQHSLKSDVDVLIKFRARAVKTLFDLLGLEEQLTKVFNRKVDLLTINSLSPFLRDEILSTSKVIYAER